MSYEAENVCSSFAVLFSFNAGDLKFQKFVGTYTCIVCAKEYHGTPAEHGSLCCCGRGVLCVVSFWGAGIALSGIHHTLRYFYDPCTTEATASRCL